MSDLISRQAAIDAVSHHGEIENDYTDLYHDGYCDGVYDSVDILEDLPAAQQWTPCSEKPPEIDKEVLVTDGEIYWVCSLFESPDIEDGLYQWEDNYGHWHEFETWVAWMPLPEPYKGEEL